MNSCSWVLRLSVGAINLILAFVVLGRGRERDCPGLPLSDDRDWHQKDIGAMKGIEVIESFLWKNESACRIVHDFRGVWVQGSTNDTWRLDGGRSLCMDPVELFDPENCLVYSFGSLQQMSFERAVHNLGCNVYLFDASSRTPIHDVGLKMHILNYGLGPLNMKEKSTGNRVYTLATIFHKLIYLHTIQDIDVLKVDAGDTQWQAMGQMIKSGILSRVKQLNIRTRLDHSEPIERVRERLEIVKSLEEHGMVRFSSRLDPRFLDQLAGARTFLAFDLTFYNRNFSQLV